MGKEEQPCVRLQLPSGQARMLGGCASLEQGGWLHTGQGCGQKPDMGELQLGLLLPVCTAAGLLGQTSPGMPVQQEAGAGKISHFLQGRSDPLALLVAYKSFDTRAI